MSLDAKRIRSAIVVALEKTNFTPQQSTAIAFHMTDWIGDLEELHALYANPDGLSPDDVEKVLMAYLSHVPNHLAAAAKLLVDMPVSDIFGVGSVECEHNQGGRHDG